MLFLHFEKKAELSDFVEVTDRIHILSRLIYIHACYFKAIYSLGLSFFVNVITTQLAVQARK